MPISLQRPLGSDSLRSVAALPVQLFPAGSPFQGTEVLTSPYDPPRRVVEWSVRLFPAGSPLQGTEITVHPNSEASLERLVPLAEFLAAWKLLPNISQWVLHIIEKGYRIQFASLPPRFQGVLPTVVDSEQALVMKQEVLSLLQKGGYGKGFLLPAESQGFTAVTSLFQRRMGGCVPF